MKILSGRGIYSSATSHGFRLTNIDYCRRSGAERFDLQVFRVTDTVACSPCGQSGSCVTSGQGSEGHQDPSVRAGHVAAGAVQHMSAAVFGNVHIRHIWNVVFHERGEQRWT